MTPEFWLERWQNSEIGFHQADINGHLQQFWPELNPAAGNTVFVPLCGKSRDMLWLRSQGHSVLGAEISPIAVNGFFAENGLSATTEQKNSHNRWQSDGITLLEGDFFKLTPQDTENVNHVFDRASIVALPPALRGDYARHLIAILPRHANILLLAFDYDQSEMDGPPFSVGMDEIVALYGQHYAIKQVWQQDVLADYPPFRERGLRGLRENVYLLTPNLQ